MCSPQVDCPAYGELDLWHLHMARAMFLARTHVHIGLRAERVRAKRLLLPLLIHNLSSIEFDKHRPVCFKLFDRYGESEII